MHDYHLHTNFSGDSRASMESMVIAAINAGLNEIAFTDHVDYSFGIEISSFEKYFSEIERFKEKYKKQINIVCGIELGLGSPANARNSILVHKYPFDFIIGSTHEVNSKDLYMRDHFRHKDKYKAYSQYFEEILGNIKTYTDFSVYGHFDYITRYGVYNNNDLLYEDYADYIDAIFKMLIDLGKGIEINTSGFRYNLNTIHPQIDILKRYFELGGEIITVGSDAHDPAHVADHSMYVKDLLETLGIRHICNFRNKKPVFVDL